MFLTIVLYSALCTLCVHAAKYREYLLFVSFYIKIETTPPLATYLFVCNKMCSNSEIK